MHSPTPIEIRRETEASLASYGGSSAAYEVLEIVDVAALRPGATTLTTRVVTVPWIKDYDAWPGNDPGSWPSKFDVQHWIFLAACIGDVRVGGAVVVVRPVDVIAWASEAVAFFDSVLAKRSGHAR